MGTEGTVQCGGAGETFLDVAKWQDAEVLAIEPISTEEVLCINMGQLCIIETRNGKREKDRTERRNSGKKGETGTNRDETNKPIKR